MASIMEKAELENHLRQLVADPYNSAGKAAAATRFFRHAVEHDQDISSHVDALKTAFLEHSQLAVITPIAEALTLHCLRRSELEMLSSLLGNKHFFQYILDSLRKLESNKVDISAAIPCLIRNGGASPVLIPYIKKNRSRLKPVLEAMLAQPSARNSIPGLLSDYLFDGEQHDVADALPILVSLFAKGNLKLKESIACTLRLAAEQGTGFELVTAEIERFLKLKNEVVQTRVAYALSWFYGGKNRWAQVDRLVEHPASDVRFGAIWALSVTLNSRQVDTPELVSRLARGLADVLASNRNFALSGLKIAEAREKNILPDRPVFDFLLTKMADRHAGLPIIDYVYSCCTQDHALVAASIAAIAQLKPTGWEECAMVLQGLLKACREMEARQHVPACLICEQLPREALYRQTSDVPQALLKLKKIVDGDLEICPTCSTHYIHTYHEETTSWTEGMGAEIEIVVRRLCPTDLLDHLKNEALAAFKHRYDGVIEQLAQNLNHPRASVREDAAWGLTKHYLKLRQVDQVAGLLRHPIEAVRVNAAQTIRNAANGAMNGALDAAPWSAVLVSSLADESGQVRESAAAILGQWYFRTGQFDAVDALLALPDVRVRRAAIFQVNCAAREKIDIRRFFPALRSCLTDTDETIRRYAGWALEHAPAGEQEDIVKVLIEKLADTRPEVRQEAMGALAHAVQQGVDIWATYPALVDALGMAELRWHAMKVLQAAISGGSNIAFAIPAIVSILADRKIGMYKDDFILLLGAMERQGIDIAAAIPELANAVLDDRNKAVALPVLLSLARNGADLGGAVRQLKKALSDHDAYYRQETVKVLTTEFANKKNWKAIAACLTHAKNDVRAVAAQALGEIGPADVDISLIPLLVKNLLPDTDEHESRSYCSKGALIALANVDKSVAQRILDEIGTSKKHAGRKVCREVIASCETAIAAK